LMKCAVVIHARILQGHICDIFLWQTRYWD